MAIDGWDAQSMVTHWLRSPAGRRFGVTYGTDVETLLHRAQDGPAVEAVLRKLVDDVPITAASGVNAYTRPVGIDGLDLIVEAAGQLVSLRDAVTDAAVLSYVDQTGPSGVDSYITPASSVVQSRDSGAWTGAAVSASLAVVVAGSDVTASCSFAVVNGPGVTVSASGPTLSLVAIDQAASTAYADVVITGPFPGQIVRRWSLAKDYSIPGSQFEVYERAVLRFEGDLTDLQGGSWSGVGYTFGTDSAGGGSVNLNGGTTLGVGGGNHISSAPSLAYALQDGDWCIEAMGICSGNATRRKPWVSLTQSGAVIAQIGIEKIGGTTYFYGAWRSQAGETVLRKAGYTYGQRSHLALLRRGFAVWLLVDGVALSAGVLVAPVSGNVPTIITVGNVSPSGDDALYGELSGVRLTSGSSRYDPALSPITIPAQPI